VTLSPYTRLSLAELADRLADDEDADAAQALDPGAVWADAYARASASGAGPSLAARRADAAAADARRIRDQITAEGAQP